MASEEEKGGRRAVFIPCEGYRIGEWCSNLDGKNPEAIVIEVPLAGSPFTAGLRFRSRRATQECIDALTKHMNNVWPVFRGPAN